MPQTIVIFGASGDLTSRKLIPALYRLHRQQRLPAGTRIVGVSRTDFSHDAWRDSLAASTAEFTGEDFEAEDFRQFASDVYYHAGDVNRLEDFQSLARFLDQEIDCGADCTRAYYLATMPSLYERAIEHLGAAGLADEAHGPRRVVIEKPFGSDLATAQQLNESLHKVFREDQVYRIDHYLGKETVQNLLVLRLANTVFEPIWNRNFIDNVQITVAEEVTVEGRADYYDRSGVLRDMLQNHLLQLMMITAMEAPARFEANMIRDEKVKVLRSIRSLEAEEVAAATVRGQYEGYLQEEGVAPGSQTATFAVVKLLVENWRFSGVPFYLRSGKGMSCRTTQIVIRFREPPHRIFGDGMGCELMTNQLVIQVQPAEGIQLHFNTKVPDAGMRLSTATLDFRFDRHFKGRLPDAYQRLLLDLLSGDASLFARSDEVELAWSIIDPIQQAWENGQGPPLQTHPLGDWGPAYSNQWIAAQGRQWFDVCPVLH